MFNNFHLWSSQIVLITEPTCILVSIMHNRLWIAVHFDAPKVFSLLWNLTKEDRYKVQKNKIVQETLTQLSSSGTYYADWWAFEWKCATCRIDRGSIESMSPFPARLLDFVNLSAQVCRLPLFEPHQYVYREYESESSRTSPSCLPLAPTSQSQSLPQSSLHTRCSQVQQKESSKDYLAKARFLSWCLLDAQATPSARKHMISARTRSCLKLYLRLFCES